MGLILKTLGLVDIVAGVALLLASIVDFPTRIILLLGGGLIIKGVAFFGNAVSLFDLVLGLYVLLTAVWSGFGALNVLFGCYLLLKGFYSFV